MPFYRVFFVDRDGHVFMPPEIVESEDDQGAIEQARQKFEGEAYELWKSDRLVFKGEPGRMSRKSNT